jgi:hypothetical protein
MDVSAAVQVLVGWLRGEVRRGVVQGGNTASEGWGGRGLWEPSNYSRLRVGCCSAFLAAVAGRARGKELVFVCPGAGSRLGVSFHPIPEF